MSEPQRGVYYQFGGAPIDVKPRLPEFESSFLTLERASDHVVLFHREAYAYGLSRPLERFTETDDRGYITCKYRTIKPIPGRLRAIAADCLNTLRASLDQACYASATALAPGTKPRNAYFPSASDPAKLENISKGRSADLHPEIVGIARALKPYTGGDDELYFLTTSSASNRHADLVPAVGNVAPVIFGTYTIVKGTDADIEIFTPKWSAEREEFTFFKIAPHAVIDFRATFGINVGFAGTLAFTDNSAPGVLISLGPKVINAVRQIEAKTQELLGPIRR